MDAKLLLSQSEFWTLPKDITRLLGFDYTGYFSELVTRSTLYNKKGKLDEDGYFYYTADWIEINTGLSRHTQHKALQILKEFGLVSTILKGLPAKVHYRINHDNIFDFFIKVEEYSSAHSHLKLDFNHFKNWFLTILKTLYKEEEIKEEVKENIKRKKRKRTTRPKKKRVIPVFYNEFTFFKEEFLEIWFTEFIPMKKLKKAVVSERALKSQLKKIAELSKGAYGTALAILEKSVNNGWTDFYELNSSKNKTTPKGGSLRSGRSLDFSGGKEIKSNW